MFQFKPMMEQNLALGRDEHRAVEESFNRALDQTCADMNAVR